MSEDSAQQSSESKEQTPAGSARPERPRPQYGELAPEGWSWQPPSEEGAGAATAVPAGQKPGVPHNLGIAPVRKTQSTVQQPQQQEQPPAASRAAQVSAADSTEETAKQHPADTFVAPVPEAVSSQATQAESAPAQNTQQSTVSAVPASTAEKETKPATAGAAGKASSPQDARAKERAKRDSIATIILLVLGAFGAMNSASGLMQTPATLSLIASALNVENFSAPASVETTAAIGALTIIGIQAASLLLSIWRLTRKKLAFWIPLAAFGVALIALFAFTFAMWAQVPELMSHLQDPSSLQTVLDYLQNSIE